MDKKQIFVESTVGLFAFAVLAVLFLLTVVLSREALFRSSTEVDILFDDVMGLRVGDNVMSRGLVVGKIKAMDFQDGDVRVTALLSTPLTFREGYLAEVLSSSLLGGRYLHLAEGPKDAAPVPLPAAPARLTLSGSPSADLIDSATRTIEDVRAALEDGVLDDLKAAISSLRSVADNIASGQGTLGKLVADDTLYDNLNAAVADVRAITARLEAGEGTLGKLLSPDDSLYADLSSAVASLRAISTRLENGEGTLGKLLSSDDTLYTDLSTAVASLRTVADNIASGEGTLGKLVSDQALYDDLLNLLRQARAAIDDIRETSPVSTFSSVFFGIF